VGHEGNDWAPFLNTRGIAAFVLEYRMPKGLHDVPLEDVQRALTVIRSHAAEWHINPALVGIMGSSAGGHLAATAATLLPAAAKPAFQILFYPVISMQEGITHQGSRNNLLGQPADPVLVQRYSLEQHVTRDTPKAFITLSGDDKVVPPRNAIDYYSALQRLGIPTSLHVYPTGDHGWGIQPRFPEHPQMLEALSKWLETINK
jgi:acetyl esterase/lipase